MNITILSIMIIYLLSMLLIGVYFSRKKLDYNDFHLGGDKVPGWVLAFSERSTEASAWLLLGATGFAFSTGLSSIWLFIGIILGIIFSWLFLSKKFMDIRKKYKVLTLPDYLSIKFPKHGNLIRGIGALIVVSFFTFYISAQFGGAGDTLQETLGIPPLTGVIVVGAIVIIYSSLGGFLSVAWTDAIQAILMVITLVVLPIVGLFVIWNSDLSISNSLAQAGAGMNSWTGGVVGFGLGALLFNNLSWVFGFMGGQPHMSARLMALRDERDVKTGKIVAIIWGVLAYVGAFLIGIIGRTLYDNGSIANSEMILPIMVTDLLPSWIAGILLSGILAAIMSTASSQILVVTSSISEDVMHKMMGLKLTGKQLVLISRLIVIIMGVAGLIIGLISDNLIYVIVGWAWAGVGNSFGAAIILAFFWKKTSGSGVVAALLTGSIGTIIWITTGLDEILSSRGVTFFLALLAGVIVSLAIPDDKTLSQKESQEVS